MTRGKPGRERDRYLEALFQKVEERGRPSPDLLDRIERLIGVQPQPPGQVDTLGKPEATVQGIAGAVARHFGVALQDVLGKSREEPLPMVRHLAMRLARELTGASYPTIGAAFGREHSTVMYACERTAGMAVGDVVEAIQSEFVVVHKR